MRTQSLLVNLILMLTVASLAVTVGAQTTSRRKRARSKTAVHKTSASKPPQKSASKPPQKPPAKPGRAYEKIFDREAEEKGAQKEEDSQDGVYPGERVFVRFKDLKLTEVTAKLDDGKASDAIGIPLQQDKPHAGDWSFRIPANALPTDSTEGSLRTFSLTSTTDGKSLGSFTVAVFPAPDAKISKILQRSYDKNADKVNLIIQGQGLFAPTNKIHLNVGESIGTVTGVNSAGDRIYAEFKPDDTTPYRIEPLSVKLWNIVAEFPDASAATIQTAKPLAQTGFLWYALTAFIVVGVVVLTLASKPNIRLPRPFENLLLERVNQTYSLSYFQFYLWGAIIVFGWLFIFVARGFLNDNWQFPSLAGFAYTFLISLGTLVTAQATNSAKGVKGSGVIHPSLSDLIYNGGVLAPERVQHLVWTLLSACLYLIIIVTSAFTITALPVIPNELLVLMGLSSAGYVGGKLARKPGPVIGQVATVSAGSIAISGQHLSRNAAITMRAAADQPVIEIPQNLVKPLKSDPEQPDEFATILLVTLPPNVHWYAANAATTWHLIVTNTDAQQSEMDVLAQAPPPDPAIDSITVGERDANGDSVVALMGHNVQNGATVSVQDLGSAISWRQDPTNPNRFTAPVPHDAEWLGQPQTFTVVNPFGGQGQVTQQLVGGAPVQPAQPPATATIATVTVGALDAQAQIPVTAMGTNIPPGATLSVQNDNQRLWQQDPANPNRFTITVAPNTTWLQPPRTLILTVPGGPPATFIL